MIALLLIFNLVCVSAQVWMISEGVQLVWAMLPVNIGCVLWTLVMMAKE